MMILGADTEALRDHARRSGDNAGRLDEIGSRLDGLIESVSWVGPDAEAFRVAWTGATRAALLRVVEDLRADQQQLEQEAEEQDTTSSSEDSGSGGGTDEEGSDRSGSPWDRLGQWLDDYESLESDGFFGDLLGGPESGYWGSLAWNAAGIPFDIAGMIPDPTGALTIAGLPMDVANVGIGLYDAAQSFQDGDFFGTVDGLTTAGINGLDAAFGVVGLVPHPVTKAIGEVGGIATGALDILWSEATMAAQASAISGGPGGGSTSRFLLSLPGVAFEQVTGSSAVTDATDASMSLMDAGYDTVTSFVRDQVPIIDPMIDVPQRGLEAVSDAVFGDSAENLATSANEWIRDRVPW